MFVFIRNILLFALACTICVVFQTNLFMAIGIYVTFVLVGLFAARRRRRRFA